MKAAIIGIDPGLDGALARYVPATGDLEVVDMPTLTIGTSKSGKRVIDEYALARLVDGWSSDAACVWLELVGVRPGEGGVAGFSFGRGYGLLRGVCVANFLTIHDATPATWKRALKVAADKDHARHRASALFPRHGALWPLKKHHGRAEAALIALYGSMQAVSAIAPNTPITGAAA
jgi:crossover junction endodeoxyribonuclease RuvC